MAIFNKVLSCIPSPKDGAIWTARVFTGAATKAVLITGKVAHRALGHLTATGADVLYGAISAFNDMTGVSKADQLAFIINKFITLPPGLDDYLKETLAPTLSVLVSEISIDRLFNAFTRSVRDYGPLNRDAHIQAVVNELKAIYDSYLDRHHSGSEKEGKTVAETKRIAMLIIDTFVEAVQHEPTLQAKINIFKDKAQCATIMQKALSATCLIQEGKLSPQRATTFLRYAMPSLERMMIEGSNTLSPSHPHAISGLLNFAASSTSLNIPGRAHLADFIRAVDSYGLCCAVEFSIKTFGEDQSRAFLKEIGMLISLNIQESDLDRIFNGNQLSQEGYHLLQSIEHSCEGKPTLKQIPFALAAIFNAIGYIEARNIEAAGQAINDCIYRIGSGIVIDHLATKTLPKVAQMEVVDHDKIGAKKLLPTILADQVTCVNEASVSSDDGIKKTLNELLPWVIFSTLCTVMGHGHIGSKENYLAHIAPNLDATVSVKRQVYQMARIIRVRLLPAYGVNSKTVKAKLVAASLALSSTELIINLMLNQTKRTLTLASYQLSNPAVLDRSLLTLNTLLEELKTDVLALEERGLVKGSDEWQVELATIIEERKRALFNTLSEEINYQILALPATKFNTLVAVIKDPSLSFIRKTQLATLAFIEMIFSPFIALCLRLVTLYTDTISMENHPLYQILSTVFQLLNIEDNNNLLSNIFEETNVQLEMQVDTLLVDKQRPDPIHKPNPQLDQFLLDSASSVMDQASQLEGDVSLSRLFANFMHHGRSVAQTVRESIQDSMKPEDIRGYMHSALKTFIPKTNDDKPSVSYVQHIDTLQERVVEATCSALQSRTRQRPYSHGSSLFQLKDLFATEANSLSLELSRLAQVLASSQKDLNLQELAMKKIHLKMVYFLQEIEKSQAYLEERDSSAMKEYKLIVANWHQRLSDLTKTLASWRGEKDLSKKNTQLVLFQAQTHQMVDTLKSQRPLEIIDIMWESDDEAFSQWSRHNPMAEKIMPVVQANVPGMAKKHIMGLSRMVTLLSATSG